MELLNLLLTFLVGAAGFYYIFLKNIYFFKSKGIEYTMPVPIFGNMVPFVFGRLALVDLLNVYYKKYKDLKYFGFFDFMAPTIVIRDPELFSSIAIKNFDNFTDHLFFIDSRVDPLLGRNLFNLSGDDWRDMRKILSPSFTLSKMKMMFELVRECAENSTNFIANQAKTGKEYEIRSTIGRYATDVVASCAFGISVDSMRDPENEFYKLAISALDMNGIVSLKMLLSRSFPFLSTVFGMRIFEKKVTDFFHNIVVTNVKTREENGIVRPDMIQLMMEARKENSANFQVNDMTAQAFVFFLAGFETMSTALSIALHQLAVHPEMQETLRNEIDEVMKESNGRPSYEDIMNMKYMDAVFTEILRGYPVTSFLDRVCTKEFELPPPKPGGKSVMVKPGTVLWFLPYAVQHDPNYYTDPNKLDPERFLNNKPEKSTYVPFGIGPRSCIGNRFALMEAKTVLFYLFAKCTFETCAKTSVPIKFTKNTFFMGSADGFWLKIKSRVLSQEENCVSKA